MDRGDVQELLDAFGKLAGMDSLELDETGRVGLAVDEAFTIEIEHDAVDGVLLFSVDLASLGADPEPAHLLTLLRGNFCFDRTAGATLALTGPENLVVLQQQLRLDSLDVSSLAQAVEAIAAAVEEWTPLIARMADSADEPLASEQALPSSGAMRV